MNGPLGELDQVVPQRMKIEQGEGEILVTRPTERGEDRALHGLTRTLIANMVEGVTKGFEKHLEIQGVGYRAALRGTDLELNVGYSHSVVDQAAARDHLRGAGADAGDRQGHDKQQVGQTAAEVRQVRPPEPYKGKGIRYATRSSAGRSGSAHEPSPRVRRASAAIAGFAARSPARPSGRASRSSARTRESSPS